MRKILFIVLLAFISITDARQVYSPLGTNDSSFLVNSKTGTPALKQDMIDNINTDQPNRQLGFTFGRNSNINNIRCDLWDGPTCVYVFPAAAQQMQVVSTSANDTLAGTGVQKVEIHYLDINYVEHIEDINMNGLTPVNTVATNILRVNYMHAIQLGSGGTTAGNVSLRNTAGTITYSYMVAGYDFARQAIYTVPANKYGYISHWQASSGAITGSHFTTVTLRSTAHSGLSFPGVFLVVDEVGLLNNSISVTLPIPIRIPPMTDVKMTAISDASNAAAQVTGAITGWFEQ